MPWLETRGCRLYYERHGTHGHAILLLHGAGSNAATWWQQLPAFAAEYQCLAMDIRCFGRSGAALESFTLQALVEDALAVLDAEQIERCVVVGQSLGGMIGLRLALNHPRRVLALAACDSSLAIGHDVLVAHLARRFETVPAVAIEQRALGLRFLREKPALAGLYAQINRFNPSAQWIPADAWRRTLLSLNDASQRVALDDLKRLACPTLFLAGREDPIVPHEVMRELAGLVARGECAVIENAAHSAYFEEPEHFNRLVLDFLVRHLRQPPRPS